MAQEADASMNGSDDGSADSGDESVSFAGSDNGYADDVPVDQPNEEMAPDDDVNWPSDPEPNPDDSPVLDPGGDNGQTIPADFAR